MSEGQEAGEPSSNQHRHAGDRALRPGWRDHPHPARFDPADPDNRAAIDAHRLAVSAGQAGYLDPRSGLFVMTSVYLHDRGWCCDRGCRHCPYVGAATPT